MSPKTIKISISLDDQLLRQFDEKRKREGYPGRSEAFRVLIREYLKRP